MKEVPTTAAAPVMSRLRNNINSIFQSVVYEYVLSPSPQLLTVCAASTTDSIHSTSTFQRGEKRGRAMAAMKSVLFLASTALVLLHSSSAFVVSPGPSSRLGGLLGGSPLITIILNTTTVTSVFVYAIPQADFACGETLVCRSTEVTVTVVSLMHESRCRFMHIERGVPLLRLVRIV